MQHVQRLFPAGRQGLLINCEGRELVGSAPLLPKVPKGLGLAWLGSCALWVDAPPRFFWQIPGKTVLPDPVFAAPLPPTRKLPCTFLKIVVARQHQRVAPFEDQVQHPSNQSRCPSARRRSASPARYVNRKCFPPRNIPPLCCWAAANAGENSTAQGS